MFRLRGPLFFSAARSLRDALEAMPTPPRVFILRMRNVPMIASSGVAALSAFMRRCRARGVAVIVPVLRPQPKEVLTRLGVGLGLRGRTDTLRLAEHFPGAPARAAELIADRPAES